MPLTIQVTAVSSRSRRNEQGGVNASVPHPALLKSWARPSRTKRYVVPTAALTTAAAPNANPIFFRTDQPSCEPGPPAAGTGEGARAGAGPPMSAEAEGATAG